MGNMRLAGPCGYILTIASGTWTFEMDDQNQVLREFLRDISDLKASRDYIIQIWDRTPGLFKLVYENIDFCSLLGVSCIPGPFNNEVLRISHKYNHKSGGGIHKVIYLGKDNRIG
jgi:hypothetical protein